MQRIIRLLALAGLFVSTNAPGQDSAIALVDQWQYTMRRPAKGWMRPDFDAAGWQTGSGGFGTYGTPGARIGTPWGTNSIWLRKTFEYALCEKPAFFIHHDENAEVFINGKLALKLEGYSTNYQLIELDGGQKKLLTQGMNQLSVRCTQTGGGQFIDVHVVDSENVPDLPKPVRSTKPFQSKLMTRWGAKVTAENAWTEYPRPQQRRDDWHCLNGEWDYCITDKEQVEVPEEWAGEILVPYPLESKLSGVNRLLDASEALWYHRSFVAEVDEGTRTLLNFEAVDYACEVIVNSQSVAKHRGGNTPFSVDVSDAIVDGENSLVVRVQDETEKFQLRGKQTLNARGIWYTQVSGIWQTVWMETVPQAYIGDLTIGSADSLDAIHVTADLAGVEGEYSLRVTATDASKKMRSITTTSGKTAVVPIPKHAQYFWTPQDPHLYDLVVELISRSGEVVDRVHSYAGLRSVGKVRDENGHWRFTLNGEIVFHWGPLDQGWWPDGLLTPPSDEAMLFDIEWLKASGFNMIRKHIKVEPRRYYSHCDRIGMMVWQDHVSGGPKPAWTRLKANPKDADWPEQQHQQFMVELERMVDTLESHPSIVCWVPFNEAWGQHRTVEVGKWMVQRDQSRLVNIASGGNFWEVGDIVDAHAYPDPVFPAEQSEGRFNQYIKVMGEFGGHGLAVKEHLWDANRRNWGYGGLPQDEAEYKARYAKSLRLLNQLRGGGIAAGVYTQTTDVEGEINGLMTYDRKVIKLSAKELSAMHKILFQKVAKVAPPQFPDSAFIEKKTNRKPGAIMDAQAIADGLKSHDRALYIKAGWIRDPYITLGPDDYYYLTGTQPNVGDPRESENPYNIGLGSESIVGEQVRAYRSEDLIDWDDLGVIFDLNDTLHAQSGKKKLRRRHVWAPEIHWLGDRWALVHCPKGVASLAISAGEELTGPWSHPMGANLGQRHDPSIFTDEDGARYLLWQNTLIAPLNQKMTKYTADPVRIDPASSRPGPDGRQVSRIGHEGATMIKVGSKYVHLGTAWSTDQVRKGSYNLYYCDADRITGPYGPRKFVGRFLGHGTPFQDKDGKWWCTAFFNGNVPPLNRVGIQTRDLGQDAQTINEQGVTIVPLDVRLLDNGEVYIRAKDPAYATPGPDEAQDFGSR